jgi:hypothetical protein
VGWVLPRPRGAWGWACPGTRVAARAGEPLRAQAGWAWPPLPAQAGRPGGPEGVEPGRAPGPVVESGWARPTSRCRRWRRPDPAPPTAGSFEIAPEKRCS